MRYRRIKHNKGTSIFHDFIVFDTETKEVDKKLRETFRKEDLYDYYHELRVGVGFHIQYNASKFKSC